MYADPDWPMRQLELEKARLDLEREKAELAALKAETAAKTAEAIDAMAEDAMKDSQQDRQHVASMARAEMRRRKK
jgi:hypothetical protein